MNPWDYARSQIKTSFSKSDALLLLFVLSQFAAGMFWFVLLFFVVGFFVYLAAVILIGAKIRTIVRSLKSLSLVEKSDRNKVRFVNVTMLVVSLVGFGLALYVPIGFLTSFR